MSKNFKEWHHRKSAVEELDQRPFFQEKQVWFCHLGINVGFEQDGRGADFLRPIVIIKKFNKQIFWGIPLSKSRKKNSPFYLSFSFIKDIESTALISQIRLIDAKRLARHIGYISNVDYLRLTIKLKELLP